MLGFQPKKYAAKLYSHPPRVQFLCDCVGYGKQFYTVVTFPTQLDDDVRKSVFENLLTTRALFTHVIKGCSTFFDHAQILHTCRIWSLLSEYVLFFGLLEVRLLCFRRFMLVFL